MNWLTLDLKRRIFVPFLACTFIIYGCNDQLMALGKGYAKVDAGQTLSLCSKSAYIFRSASDVESHKGDICTSVIYGAINRDPSVLNSSNLILLVAPDQPDDGHYIEIESARLEGGTVVINCKVMDPRTGTVASSVMRPFITLRVPKTVTDVQVTFRQGGTISLPGS